MHSVRRTKDKQLNRFAPITRGPFANPEIQAEALSAISLT